MEDKMEDTMGCEKIYKRIYFCVDYDTLANISTNISTNIIANTNTKCFGAYLSYKETEKAINDNVPCIFTLSMAHFSFDLITSGYEIYLCYVDKIVRIEPHMDLSGIGEPCKDLRFGHNIFKLFRAGVFNDLINFNIVRNETKDEK